MRLRLAALLVSLLVAATANAQRVPDWKAVEAEAIATIQSYVRINTSNPPGDVTKAADFLVAILEREGVPVKRYESAPGRSIVLARLKGTGPAKPLLLLHHMDVVADRSIALGPRPLRCGDRRRPNLGPRCIRHEGPGRDPADGVPVAEAAQRAAQS